jgi:PHD/YefM family antitoxin component YafN of YafNO toxin-antitoxin module
VGEVALWRRLAAEFLGSAFLAALVMDSGIAAQIITRHGEEVAVVVDIAEYRRLTRPTVDLTGLLGEPELVEHVVVRLRHEAPETAPISRASRSSRARWRSSA